MATVNLNNLSRLRHKYLPVLLNYQNAADSTVRKTRSLHTNTTFAIPIKDNLFRSAKKSVSYYRFYSIKAAGDESVSDEEYRNEHNITIIGDDIPSPYTDIEKSDFPAYIKDFLRNEGFAKPTVIQSQGWPIALNGQNFVGIAQTGTGKTLAYLLPAVVHIKEKEAQRGLGPRVLVLAPTRELARQIEQVAVKFRRLLNIRCACIYGGASRLRQLEQLQAGVDIVIATPGRLNDFITSKSTSLSRCKYVVLDEADRMLDMGFEPQIRQALEGIPLERQILMFSATWPKEIQQLAREYLGEFVQVNVGSVELSANHNIQQNFHFCEEGDSSKYKVLNSIMQTLSGEGLGKVLVFANTKKRVDYLTAMLRNNGFYALGIHGDKSQMQRDTIIYKFKKGSVNILIATEVAARGLDVDGITHVINYDFPPICEDYIHRIGRTGRSQNKGVSHTLLTNEDARQAGSLISILKEANQEVPEELVQLWRDYKSNKIQETTRKFKPKNNNWNSKRPWNRYRSY